MAKNRTLYVKKEVIIPGVFLNTDRQSKTANITFSESYIYVKITNEMKKCASGWLFSRIYKS